MYNFTYCHDNIDRLDFQYIIGINHVYNYGYYNYLGNLIKEDYEYNYDDDAYDEIGFYDNYEHSFGYEYVDHPDYEYIVDIHNYFEPDRYYDHYYECFLYYDNFEYVDKDDGYDEIGYYECDEFCNYYGYEKYYDDNGHPDFHYIIGIHNIPGNFDCYGNSYPDDEEYGDQYEEDFNEYDKKLEHLENIKINISGFNKLNSDISSLYQN